MNTSRIFAALFGISLMVVTAHAQAQPATLSEAQVKEQLQQASQLALLAQKQQGQDRMNSLRELERLFAKLQQKAQTGDGTVGADQAVALRQAVEVLQRAANFPGAGDGRRTGISTAGGDGTRLVVRQNGLGGGLNVQVGGGAWWTDAALTTRLGLTEDQKARIDRAFVNHRTTLEATRDNLVKEEALLARFLDAEPLDRNAVSGQIFRVSNARGEVERANAAMTLEMREQMTRAQWNQLQTLSPRATVTIDVPISPVTTDAVAPAGGLGVRGPGGRGGRGQ
jgi:hypothetical protein